MPVTYNNPEERFTLSSNIGNSDNITKFMNQSHVYMIPDKYNHIFV